ncbi:MAG: hypothetical protein KatS3mg125_1229 [Lysobacterales bacterium]|jgi:hypothetical protein|nr:MAG: hypothetical protein KatS3mg125_1229 [Xanthomonadales bacterium]
MRARALILFMVVAVIAAWWLAGGPRRGEQNPFLADIPADTPFFALSLERVPAAVAKAHLRHAALDRESLLSLIMPGLKIVVGELDGDVVGRLREALPEKFDEQGFGRLGLAANFHFAFYAVGGDPVFRLEIADRERVRQALTHLLRLPSPQVRGEGEWWRIDSEAGEVHLLLSEHALTIAGALAPVDEQRIALLLAEKRPSPSLADDPSRIGRLRESLALGPHWLGELDLMRYARVLAARDDQTGECGEAIAAASERMGGLGFGLRRLSEEALEAVLELRLTQDETSPPLRPPTPAQEAQLRLVFAPIEADRADKALAAMERALDACGPVSSFAPAVGGLRGILASLGGESEFSASLALHELRFVEGRPSLSLSAVLRGRDDEIPSLNLGALGMLLPLDDLSGLPGDGSLRPLGSEARLGGLHPAFASRQDEMLGLSFADVEGASLRAHLAAPPVPTGTILELTLRGALLEQLAQEGALGLRWIPGAEQTLSRWRERGASLERLDLSLRQEERGLLLAYSARYRAP